MTALARLRSTSTVLILGRPSMVIECGNLILLERGHVDAMLNLITISAHVEALK